MFVLLSSKLCMRRIIRLGRQAGDRCRHARRHKAPENSLFAPFKTQVELRLEARHAGVARIEFSSERRERFAVANPYQHDVLPSCRAVADQRRWQACRRRVDTRHPLEAQHSELQTIAGVRELTHHRFDRCKAQATLVFVDG